MYEDLKELSKYEDKEESDSNSNSTNSDEDEIEEEIDIYLNNVNENNLNNINTYLIQYPLRPKYRPYNFTNNIQNIYTSKNYNKLKHIKNNFSTNEETYVFEYKLHAYAKDDIHESNITYKNEATDKNISRLISTSVLCEYITNCVCIFQYNEIKKKKEIFMIPLKHIYQFKPCHDNINFDVKFKEENKNNENVTSNLKNNMEIENNKYTNENISNNSDIWTSIVNIYDPDSYEAHEILSLFTNIDNKNNIIGYENNKSTNKEIKDIKFNSDDYLYLNNICKNAKEENSSSYVSNNKERKSKDNKNSLCKIEDDIYMNINMLYFFSLTLDEQLLKLFRIKNVQRFDEIKKVIKKNVNDELLLNTIKNYCVNILGLWVIKSKYLYKFLKGKEKKNENDKKSETFSYVDYKIRVRDLLLVILFKQVESILLKFIHDRKIQNNTIDLMNNDNSSKKINSSTSIIIENFEKATNLSNHVLLEIFTPLCEYKYTGYFFKYKLDETFLVNNINLCLSYNEKWKNKMMKIAKIIQTYKNSKIIINDYKLDTRTLEKNITDLLHNNCLSYDDIYNKIKKEARNTNIDLQIFNEALNNIAININNMWSLKIEHESEFNNCRNAVINIYHNNHNAILSKKEIIQEVENYIKSSLNIPDIYFRNILKEFCVQKNGKYLFKGNDQLKNA